MAQLVTTLITIGMERTKMSPLKELQPKILYTVIFYMREA